MAKELVSRLLTFLTNDLNLVPGDDVDILVNGTGSTPLEELYIAYKEAHDWFSQRGIKIYKPYVGEYATSLEMSGFSISILELDESMKAFLQVPVNTPFIKQL